LIDEAVVLTTSNLDRASINIEAAKLNGNQKERFVSRWRCKLKKKLGIQYTLYDEEKSRELFAHLSACQ
jgi:hypothetical protein